MKVDVIANTGDIFDSNRPTSRMFRALVDVHNILVEAGIPMLVISGNHDFTEPNWLEMIDERPDSGVIFLDRKTWTHAPSGVRFHGIPWASNAQLAADFAQPAQADILLVHVLLSEFGYPDPSNLSLAQLPPGYRAILGGDIHIPALGRLADGTPFAYCGSIELCKNDEPLDKQAWLWTADGSKDKLPNPVAVPLPSRKTYVLRLNTEEDMSEALQTLRTAPERAPLVFARYDNRLVGVQARLRSALDPAAVVRAAAIPVVKSLTGVLEQDLSRKSELADFVSLYEQPGSELHDIIMRLATGKADPDITLSEFVNKQLA
jgi:DNA repair exonuclease SbcCD nuclease subunit